MFLTLGAQRHSGKSPSSTIPDDSQEEAGGDESGASHHSYITKKLQNKREAERLDHEGKDKLAYMIYDSAYDIPKDIREKVRAIIEKAE